MHKFSRNITIEVDSNSNGITRYCSKNCPYYAPTAYSESCALFGMKLINGLRSGMCMHVFDVPNVDPDEGSDLWTMNMAAEGHELVSSGGYTVYMSDGNMVLNDIYKYTKDEWLKKAPPVGQWKIKKDE